MKQVLSELKQKLLTYVANRTFKKEHGFIDKLLVKVLASSSGYTGEEDPELRHPE